MGLAAFSKRVNLGLVVDIILFSLSALKTDFVIQLTNKGADQSAPMCNLIRTFKNIIILDIIFINGNYFRQFH